MQNRNFKNELKRLSEAFYRAILRLKRRSNKQQLSLVELLGDSNFREKLFHAWPQDTPILAPTLNGNFLVSSGDLTIGLGVFSRGVAWGSDLVDWAFSIIANNKPLDLVASVGANIGTVEVYCLRSGFAERVLAFEPEKLNFELLQANLIINGLQDRATSWELALTNGDLTTVELELDGTNFGDHRVRVQDLKGEFEESSRQVKQVPAAKLSDFANENGQSTWLFFMDVPGHEGHVLDGAGGLLDKHRLHWPCHRVLAVWPRKIRGA